MPSGRSQTQKAMCRMSLWNAQNRQSSRQQQASGPGRGQWRTTVQQVLSCLWGQGKRPRVWQWWWLRNTGNALSHWIAPWSLLQSTKKRGRQPSLYWYWKHSKMHYLVKKATHGIVNDMISLKRGATGQGRLYTQAFLSNILTNS